MSKSQFLNSAELIKDKLGEGLCLAKWKQVSLHLTTGYNNSCYHPPLHFIPADSIEQNPAALHNTEYKKTQRKIMLRNERPQECSYCWTQEDLGNLSDRHYRSGESWAAQHLDTIKNSIGDEDVLPSYVEVNFNHACNLKCSYCSPQFSSTWADEANRFGAYPTHTPHNDPSHFIGSRRPIPAREYNPYVEAFWTWWPSLYPELVHFRMTGGEPLLDSNTYRVFDYVLDNPSDKLHLNVTSNFSVEPILFEKYLGYVKQLCDNENKKIEHFMQFVSLDSVGSKAEYIRYGLQYDRLLSYIERFLSEIPGRNSITFIITMNNLNVTSIINLLELILKLRKQFSSTYQRVWFDTPILRTPQWQSVQILPDSYRASLEQAIKFMQDNLETDENPFQGFKDYEPQRLKRVLDWMKQKPEQLQKDKADFYKFFNEHDQRRNTNFLKTFSEMKEFYQECKYYATR